MKTIQVKTMRAVILGALGVLLLSAHISVAAEPLRILAQLTEKGGAAPPLGKDDSCYAICKYRDAEGGEFVGTSGTSCDEACVAASDKCLKEGEGNCEKATCAMPGCE